MFDIETIQAAVGDTMIRPTNDQVVYIDLSEPDQVVVYGDDSPTGAIGEVLSELAAALGGLIEYFREADHIVKRRKRSRRAQERNFLAPLYRRREAAQCGKIGSIPAGRAESAGAAGPSGPFSAEPFF